MNPVYLTSPLYYVNADPHLGHTYTMVIVDTLARWYRRRGAETFFLTGTDEHGEKIALAAEEAQCTPEEYTARIARVFRSTWDGLGVSYDHFIRTTDADHVRFVQDVLTHIHEKGDIYFDEYEGLYCTGCERFYLERELLDGTCPDHKTVPTPVREANYFFRMSRYQAKLVEHIEKHPDVIRPQRYRNEILGALREPLEDLCISRPKTRLSWGIELPFDRQFVTYVWFDALLNYASVPAARGRAFLDRFWPEAQHFIGKDILKPHGIYWPTMLMAADLPVYRHLNVHGWWTVEGEKMSKSLGNVVRPLDMVSRYGRDAFRFFLLRDSVFGLDADFREDSLVARYNGDLANNVGNLVSRTLSMLGRYFDGEVPPATQPEPIDDELRKAFDEAFEAVDLHMENLAFAKALETLLRATDRANKYIVETAPFRLAKDPTQKGRVGTILRNLAECLRRTMELATPFLPDTGDRIADLLELGGEDRSRIRLLPWGEGFPPGHRVRKPEVLFPKLEQ